MSQSNQNIGIVPPASSSGGSKRTRSERVASVISKQRPLVRFWNELRQDKKLLLILLTLVTTVGICLVTGAWDPPLEYRPNTIPSRVIICRYPFSVASEQKRIENEANALSNVMHVFVNDPQPLVQLREALRNTVSGFMAFESYDSLQPADKAEWEKFLKPVVEPEKPVVVDPKASFEIFQAALKDNMPTFETSLKRAFSSMEKDGLLTKLDYGPLKGNQQRILVYLKGTDPRGATPVIVSDVQIKDGSRITDALTRELEHKELAQMLCQWIRPKLGEMLKGTLHEDPEATQAQIKATLKALPEPRIEFIAGQTPIAVAGKPLGKAEFKLLETEYREHMKNRDAMDRTIRFLSVYGLIALLFLLGWAFIYRHERRKPKSNLAIALMFFSMFLTVALGRVMQLISVDIGQWELVPLLIFVQCVAIMYSWEIALVITAVLAVSLSLCEGGGLSTPLILLGTSVAVATQLGRLKTRSKLIIVGAIGGFCSFLLTLSAGLIDGRAFDGTLLTDGALNFLWTFITGFIMNGLLPFVERPFGIMTDMSLRELVDVSHPLLQELIRRAPATYSHSMQVGTVAEAAADAIGARGLMTRVGAYFHDIGKIFKPEYFAENQGSAGNLHNTLEPRMSTLIIVAHVKDGADLARQHRLPQTLIDLIEQHHGTSLVSFFYGRAAKQSKESGHGDHVEEGSFRYPGPKPRSKEAGILMLSDAAESACRSIDSASPGRIESMVRQITKTKLDDGQFDDSGLTLRELRIVENSIINSLIAIKHGRLKYPGQEAVEAQGDQIDRDQQLRQTSATRTDMQIPRSGFPAIAEAK